jgi:hypothetical protein
MKPIFAAGECGELEEFGQIPLEAELLLQEDLELADLAGLDLEGELMLLAPDVEPTLKEDLFLTAPEEEFMLASTLELEEPEEEFMLEEELALPIMEPEAVPDMEVLVSLLKQYPGIKITLSF